ncbi:MAG: DNA helicase [Leptospiraceae bacterium]|nr:MAG: DNA helicase [Leptospiraceae bacterium]
MMELHKDLFSKKQWEIITTNNKYKQVIAAAGSGKTRTVIGYTMFSIENDFNANKILLLTFSKKACEELMHRFPESYHRYIEVRTFHAFCYHYIKQYHPVYSKYKFNILTDDLKEQFLKEVLEKNPVITFGIPYPILLRNFNKIQSYLPDLYQFLNRELLNYKKKFYYLEFEDLISMIINGLEKNEFWIEPLKNNYKHIIVDEFQDTDPEQMKFLTILKPEKLFIVGDDWQTIYGFRGATVIPILKFKSFFKRTKIFKLNENYRSLEPIVNTGNIVIAKSSKKSIKKVKSIRGNILKIPVLGYLLEYYKNYNFIVELIHKYQGMILVRSNYRRKFWLKKGVSEKQIMTIHKSKGLEFPVVFIDISKGWSGERNLTDEEIRILYVAITRAQNLCIILINTEINTLESFIYKQLLNNQLLIVKEDLLIRSLEKEFDYRLTA